MITNVISAVWAFVKKNWQTLALLLIVVIGWSWLQHQQSGFAKSIVDMNTAHQAEIAQIQQARAQETAELASEMKVYQDSIAKIQADYATAQASLQTQQVKEQSDIVKKYANDADGMAGLLSDKFGFVVVK